MGQGTTPTSQLRPCAMLRPAAAALVHGLLAVGPDLAAARATKLCAAAGGASGNLQIAAVCAACALHVRIPGGPSEAAAVAALGAELGRQCASALRARRGGPRGGGQGRSVGAETSAHAAMSAAACWDAALWSWADLARGLGRKGSAATASVSEMLASSDAEVEPRIAAVLVAILAELGCLQVVPQPARDRLSRAVAATADSVPREMTAASRTPLRSTRRSGATSPCTSRSTVMATRSA